MRGACTGARTSDFADRNETKAKLLLIAEPLTCLTVFAIGMEIVTATRSTETYDSKQKSEEDDER